MFDTIVSMFLLSGGERRQLDSTAPTPSTVTTTPFANAARSGTTPISAANATVLYANVSAASTTVDVYVSTTNASPRHVPTTTPSTVSPAATPHAWRTASSTHVQLPSKCMYHNYVTCLAKKISPQHKKFLN